MRILMTGGTGFIGQQLCRRLSGRHELLVWSRRPEQVARLCGPGIQAVSTLSELDAAPPEAVINLAGAPIASRPWTEARRRELYHSRVTLTHTLVDAMTRWQPAPHILLNASAVGFYGDQGEQPLDETSPPHDEFQHRLCRDWEQAALGASALGTRVCLLRFGLVLGRGGGFLQRLLLPFRLGLGGRLGDGRQWMSWIHMEDLLDIIEQALLDSRLQGPINATAPEPVTNEAFTRSLAAQLHRPAFLPVPAAALRLALGELSTLLLGGQRVYPRRLQDHGTVFRFPSLEKALRDIFG